MNPNKPPFREIATQKYSLAKMHLAGLAVQSDEVKAIRLLRESAVDDGNQWAQYLPR